MTTIRPRTGGHGGVGAPAGVDGRDASDTLVSIVVPVYNVERYVDRCMDSVVSQTHERLDIVLVDDGSTDSSPGLCDAWAARDRRVRVVHQPNGGLSRARNVGVAQARGSFVAFMDSDDTVEPVYVERMLLEALAHRADLVVCGMRVKKRGLRSSYAPKPGIWKGAEAFRGLTGRDMPRFTAYVTAVNRLYARRLCAEVAFPEGKLFEDHFTFFRFFAAAGTVVTMEDLLYRYMDNPTGITSSTTGVRGLDDCEACLEEMRFFAELGYAEPVRRSADWFASMLRREREGDLWDPDGALSRRIDGLIVRFRALLPELEPLVGRRLMCKYRLICRWPRLYIAAMRARFRLKARLEGRGVTRPLARLL